MAASSINPFTKTRIRKPAKNGGGAKSAERRRGKVRFLALQMELQPDGQLEQLIDNSNQHTPCMWRVVCARMSCHFNQKRHNGNMQRIIWQLNNTLNLNLTQTQSEESWAQVMSQRARQWLLNEKRFVSTVSLSIHPSIHSCIHRTIKCAVRTWLRPSLLRSYKHDSALSISAHFSVCFFPSACEFIEPQQMSLMSSYHHHHHQHHYHYCDQPCIRIHIPYLLLATSF